MSKTRITPAEEWKRPREQGYLVRFPSGKCARIRPVDIGTFVRLGMMPNLLSAFDDEALTQGRFQVTAVNNVQAMQSIYALMDAIAVTCFVEPSIEKGEITLEDVSDIDKQALLQWFLIPAELLRSFRPEEVLDLHNLRPLQDDTASAEPSDAGEAMGETPIAGDA
ncbi:hypothetical protein FBQ95_17110 [Chloroflexi bacterium CFX3]|nr:hypothetical protein [Chloroflexi bacterium CFX3]